MRDMLCEAAEAPVRGPGWRQLKWLMNMGKGGRKEGGGGGRDIHVTKVNANPAEGELPLHLSHFLVLLSKSGTTAASPSPSMLPLAAEANSLLARKTASAEGITCANLRKGL